MRWRWGTFSLQLLISTLTADRVQRLPDKSGTIALTSDIPTPGTAGALLYAAADAAAGRAAIDAVSPLYVQSRGQNLVTNGAGLLGSNYNFSAATFDGADLFAGGGSFRCPATAYFPLVSDEFIPIDPTLEWQLSFYCKNGNADGTGNSPESLNYSGLILYDSDFNSVTPDDWMPKPGTSTTLAVALNPGATTITLTSAANWQNAGTIYDRGLRWWPYINSKGYSYPPYTYSRNNTRDSWAPGGIAGNVITLRVPWAGPALPAGTPVENAFVGDGSYKYTGLINSAIPATWTKITGSISGLDTARVAELKFPPGTAFAKIVFLANYNPPNNAEIKFNLIALTAVGLAANSPFSLVAASAAPLSTIFVDAATGKLAFKDAAGVVNPLY